MEIKNLKPLLISQTNINKKGGAEVFSSQLKKIFPQIKIVDVNNLKNPSLKEHQNVKNIWQFALDNYSLNNFDFIITLGIGAYPLKKNHKFKVLNFYHGNWLGFRNYCYNVISPYYHYLSLYKIPYEKRAGKYAYNIAISKFVANFLKKEKMKKIFYIYNTSFIDEIKSKQRNNIIFVGRPTREKGFDIFLSIVKYFKKEQFIAVLSGEKLTYKLPDNLTVYYNISHEKLSELYGSSFLLILPSCFEGNSFAILEAWKSGLYVIGSNVGLLWELENFPGIKIYKKETKFYIDAVNNILNNGLSMSPQHFFEKHYSFEIIKKQWEKTLEKIL